MVELTASLAITLIILAVAVMTFSGALSTRERENSRVDALTSAQAAINIMTREIANSGYGITTNGIVGLFFGLCIVCAARGALMRRRMWVALMSEP